MGRYQDGWVRLHRKLLESDLMKTIGPYKVWTALLLMASWEGGNRSVKAGGEQVRIARGQVWTSTFELSRLLGLPRTTIFRSLAYLFDSGRIGTESGTHGVLVTILNYGTYQGDELLTGTHSGTRAEHGRNGSKEEKKERKKNTTPEARWVPADHALADPGTLTLLNRCTPQLIEHWLSIYPDRGWIKREIAKAWSWILANPRKAPKSDFSKFTNSWLMRSWEKFRTGPMQGELGALTPHEDFL